MRKAQWLSYCLHSGWTKDQIDELEKVWDKFKDESGNLRLNLGVEEQKNKSVWQITAEQLIEELDRKNAMIRERDLKISKLEAKLSKMKS